MNFESMALRQPVLMRGRETAVRKIPVANAVAKTVFWPSPPASRRHSERSEESAFR
jgi:hypothetical protein